MYYSKLKFILANTLSLVLFLSCVSFAGASSVMWNTTISGAAGVCGSKGSPCKYNADTFGFNNPNISIEYRAFVKNADTGEIVPSGGLVPAGTHLKLVFDKHVSDDIYWFATGGYMDSPYGDWGYPDVKPTAQCLEKDYLSSNPCVVAGCTLKNYVPFVVRAPGKNVSGVNGSLSCGEMIDGVQNCTAITEGSVPLSFDFAPTVGKFYAQYYGVGSYYASTGGNTSCASYNNALTIKSGGHWPTYAAGMSIYWARFIKGQTTDHVDVDAEPIPYPITITPSTASAGPAKPTVSNATASCQTGTAFTLSFSSTDPDGHQLKYGIDWDNDGIVDQYVPPSGYVSSGSTQSASRTYSTSGTKNISVLAVNDQGVRSDPSPYSFKCSEGNSANSNNSCPIGYTLQGSACVFSACPSGYVLQGTQCVVSNACTTPNYCNDKDIVDGCTDKVLQSCEWSCFAGRCQGVPVPFGTISAVPSLVHPGDTSSISWSSLNVESCTVKSNNQDNWTGLSSPGTISNPINSKTTFTLRCKGIDGASPSTIQQSVDVNIAPTYEEK